MEMMKQKRIAAMTVGLTVVDLVRKLSTEPTPSLSQGFFFALGYLLLSVYLEWLQGEMRLGFPGLAAVLWLNFFIVGSFSNMIEGYFFTNVFESGQMFLMGGMYILFFSGVQAGLASIMLEKGETRLRDNLVYYIAGTDAFGWFKRIVIGALSYFPVYFFFGMLVSPFVMPYYGDPALGLVVPPFTVIIPVEILRGFLYVATLLPLAASLGADRRTNAVAFAGMLFIAGAFIPLLGDQGLPSQIIPYHMAEIFADSVVYSYVLARVFTKKKD
jgi:hypothetical protein